MRELSARTPCNDRTKAVRKVCGMRYADFPSASNLPPYFKEQGSLKSMEYLAEGIRVHVICLISDYRKYEKNVV